MNKQIVRICLLCLMVAFGSRSIAEDSVSEDTQNNVVCQHIDEFQYEIASYAVPYTSNNSEQGEDESSWIIEEYGVLYNLAQMPYEYEIPSVLKSFALNNKIDGVVLVQNAGDVHNTDIAIMQKTIEDKFILFVSQNIADQPETIVKRLMGIEATQQVKGKELHSLIQINENDDKWHAGIAKTVQKGVDKLTGESFGTEINYDRITLEQSGSFDEMFSKEQMTITIQGQGPYVIDIIALDEAVSLGDDSGDNLTALMAFHDKDSIYTDSLFVSESGRIYNCYEEN